MAEVLGLGITHYPLLAGADSHMANLLKYTLGDPDIPAEVKDPQNWSELARQEWGDDEGAAAAAGHRAQLLAGMQRCREELDAFQPDVVVVWGDDQYENFREEVVPSFCVFAYEDTEIDPFAVLDIMNIPNAWGVPQEDQSFTMRGAPEYAKSLVSDVINGGVDCAYSYQPRENIHFPHAFANTQIFLDWENIGKEFPYPMVPVAINCYGEHVIARKGGLARFAEINRGEQLDPPGPSPKRCFELGQAIGRSVRDSGKRVALVASSSWSHAFLTDRLWHLRPDTEADRELYDAMVAGDYDTWLQRTSEDVVAAGQHEMLNWYALLGAMHELGMELEWSDFVVTEIFNSNKTLAVFKEPK